MLTRKHYNVIAKELATEWQQVCVLSSDERTAFRIAVEAVARALHTDNERFNRQRFYDAVFNDT